MFKLKKVSESGRVIFIVHTKGHEYGRGFSTLDNAFAHMRAILKATNN